MTPWHMRRIVDGAQVNNIVTMIVYAVKTLSLSLSLSLYHSVIYCPKLFLWEILSYKGRFGWGPGSYVWVGASKWIWAEDHRPQAFFRLVIVSATMLGSYTLFMRLFAIGATKSAATESVLTRHQGGNMNVVIPPLTLLLVSDSIVPAAGHLTLLGYWWPPLKLVFTDIIISCYYYYYYY